LANARRGRYVLSGKARFAYREGEWLARITGGRPVSYTITRKPGRAGIYLTATWANEPEEPAAEETQPAEVHATGPVIGVDLNDGHLAVRRLDPHGNPVGKPERIEFKLAGGSARRDAQVRTPSPASPATPDGTTSLSSPLRTSTSLTLVPLAERRWAEAAEESSSARLWPTFPLLSSAAD